MLKEIIKFSFVIMIELWLKNKWSLILENFLSSQTLY